MPKPQPKWLADKMAVAARKASEATCPCGSPVLVGLDADRCALPVAVEVEPLAGPVAELRALMAGLETFGLYGDELQHRSNVHHRRDLVGRRTLHAAHRCPGGTA